MPFNLSGESTKNGSSLSVRETLTDFRKGMHRFVGYTDMKKRPWAQRPCYNLINNAIPEVPSGGSVTVSAAWTATGFPLLWLILEEGKHSGQPALSSQWKSRGDRTWHQILTDAGLQLKYKSSFYLIILLHADIQIRFCTRYRLRVPILTFS